jgi:peptidyl-prolyl cis-trans isomerase A (cyclophilin A)
MAGASRAVPHTEEGTMRSWISLALLALTVGMPGPAHCQEAGAVAAPPVVTIETTLGSITVELDSEHAPLTVANFLRYVRAGFYDGTVFHRVIDNFLIQGGGYTQNMKQKQPLFPDIKLESRSGQKNRRGTIAIARSRAPDSANCQFFINLVDNPSLDYHPTTNPLGYAVFGHVTAGWDTIDKIRSVKTIASTADLLADGTPAVSQPATPVVIRSVRLVGSAAPAGDH